MQVFCDIRFHNTCLNSFNISCLFPSGITISSTFLEFTSDLGFDFIIFSVFHLLLIPLLPRLSYALIFLGEVFVACSLVFQQYPIIFFLYLLDKFLVNVKNPYSLTYFLVLDSVEQNFLEVSRKISISISIIRQQQTTFVFYF